MTRSPAPHIPSLRSAGAQLIPPGELAELLAVPPDCWTGFAEHWEQLCDDRYAGELGTRRQRRYGHFAVRPDERGIEPLDHAEFLQPEDSNPLYLQRHRHFEPLTAAFADDPLLQRLLLLLGDVATTLDPAPQWSAKVHPFRVIAADSDGLPTPEGLHRDGVTLVSTLLIGRRNAAGGRSTVVAADGREVLAATLTEPGTLLVGDDRCTRHGVSAIRPVRPGQPAVRDVLVITFAPRGGDCG